MCAVTELMFFFLPLTCKTREDTSDECGVFGLHLEEIDDRRNREEGHGSH